MQAKALRPFGLAKGTLRQAQRKKTPTLSSIKELKVELSVATMILIVQKAGIKKKLKVKTVKNEFISRMTRNDRMPGTKKSKIKKPGNPGFWYIELSLFKAFLL
ncbi:MAG: hypothetical protein JWQ40_3280 [Segetibacter sp.]|jgi:hypothetical protein|nr:hypothetical protein [Segetibacter sp.]